MFACSALLLWLAPQLPPGADVTECSWATPEAPLVQREGTAALVGGDVIWTRAATQANGNLGSVAVDLFRTQRVELDGTVLWTDTVLGATGAQSDWPESLGRLPESWPVDTAGGVMAIALPVDGDLVVRSLDVDDGSLVWERRIAPSNPLNSYESTQGVYFDASHQQFLVVARRGEELDVRALDSGSGLPNWERQSILSTEQSPPLDDSPLSPGSAFVPGSSGLATVGTTIDGALALARVEFVDVSDGSLVWSNELFFGSEVSVALSPDGSRLALAVNGMLGPQAIQFAAATGAVEWTQTAPISYIDRDPEVRFDPAGARVLASFKELRDTTGLGPLDMGVQLTCIESSSGELVWSEAREVPSLFEPDASVSPNVSFPLDGELLWSYSLPAPGGLVSTRERLSLSTGSSLALVQSSSGAGSIYPDSDLGVVASDVLVSLGRRVEGGLGEEDLAYAHRLERVDLTALAVSDFIEPVLTGPLASSVLAFDISDDGTRGQALVTTASDSVQRLQGFDPASDALLWAVDLDAFSGAGRFILDSDPSGSRVAVVQLRVGTSSEPFSSRASVFDAGSGALIWQVDYGDTVFASAQHQSDGDKEVVLTDEELVLLSRNALSLDLAVFNAGDGSLRWSRNLNLGSSFSPVLDVHDGSVYALDYAGSVEFGPFVVSLTRLDLDDGGVQGLFLLDGFADVDFVAAKPEGIFVGRANSGLVTSKIITPALDAVEQEITGFFNGVYKLRPGEGFLRVADGFVQQVGDVLEPGEDPLTMDWTLDGFGGEAYESTLCEERRQFVILGSLGDAVLGSKEDLGIDVERGQVMWSGTDALLGYMAWQSARPGVTERAELYVAFTSVTSGVGVPSFLSGLRKVAMPSLVLRPEGPVASQGSGADVFIRGALHSEGQLLPDFYAVLGSLQLSTPGIPAGAFEVPFPPGDPLLFCTLTNCSPGVFQGFQGLLSHQQSGYARIEPAGPLGPGLLGQTAYFTWVRIDGESLGVENVAPAAALPLE